MAADSETPEQHLSRELGEVRPVPSGALNDAERAMDALLREAHIAGGHDLPRLVARHAAALGADDALIYLADLQQQVLVPFVQARPAQVGQPTTLGVDSTVAGRVYQSLHMQTQPVRTEGHSTRARVWLPLLNGTERVGVLGVTIDDASLLELDDRALTARLQRFTSMVAELVMTKRQYGDTIHRLRRTAQMGLAAEIQWALLPPLNFTDERVTVAAGLEPAYEVAGDSFDYAVDANVARFAVFDGMGHGLASAQFTSLAVASYRNARRAGLSLPQTALHVDSAVSQVFKADGFATGLLGELDVVAGEFWWISAGHLEPLVLRDGRAVRTLQTEPALPFGLNGDFPGLSDKRTLGSEQLQPGDLLLLYTDGITEARSPDGDFFGLERLIDLVTRNLAAGLPTPETMRRVVRALLEHQSGDLDDDATLVLVQWHGHPKGSLGS